MFYATDCGFNKSICLVHSDKIDDWLQIVVIRSFGCNCKNEYIYIQYIYQSELFEELLKPAKITRFGNLLLFTEASSFPGPWLLHSSYITNITISFHGTVSGYTFCMVRLSKMCPLWNINCAQWKCGLGALHTGLDGLKNTVIIQDQTGFALFVPKFEAWKGLTGPISAHLTSLILSFLDQPRLRRPPFVILFCLTPDDFTHRPSGIFKISHHHRVWNWHFFLVSHWDTRVWNFSIPPENPVSNFWILVTLTFSIPPTWSVSDSLTVSLSIVPNHHI